MFFLVAMEEAVEEYLEAVLRPAAETSRERGPGNDGRVAPVVRDHQHGQPIAYMGPKQVDQPINLAFEARRDIVDRAKQ